MDDGARQRLRSAIANSGLKMRAISEDHGWPSTYVSRVVNGNIQKPDPERLLKICQSIDCEISWILTGERLTQDRAGLIQDLATAPDSLIEQVAEFVRSNGIGPSKG